MSHSPLHPVHVLLLCHNEESIIEQTLGHYRTVLPSARITVFDNYSTDRSRELAASMGATVRTFGSRDRKDNAENTRIKNTAWKVLTKSPCWVLCLDMDEWLQVDEPSLLAAQRSGVSLLRTAGVQMVGDSKREDLRDIRLDLLSRGFRDHLMDKAVAFHRPCIQQIRYGPGAHSCRPVGRVAWSGTAFPLYHYKFLGVPYLVRNYRRNYRRLRAQRALHPGWSDHYTEDASVLEDRHACAMRVSCEVPCACAGVCRASASAPRHTLCNNDGACRLIESATPPHSLRCPQ